MSRSRILTFQIITDSRFNQDIYCELIEKSQAIVNELFELSRQKTGSCELITIQRWEERNVNFPDNTKQYRQRFHIKKYTRKITWNDIFGAINKIQAPFYKFI